MTVSRRTVVKAGAVLLAASSISAQAALSSDLEVPSTPDRSLDWLAGLRKPDFDPLVGDRFDLTGPDGSLGVELVRVRYPLCAFPKKSQPVNDDGTFSAIFASTERLEQAVYRVDHRAIGPVYLLLVPIGERDGRFLMEAAFNRTAAPN